MVRGIFEKAEFYLPNKKRQEQYFQITNVETLQAIEYQEKMQFTSLSPIVSTTLQKYNGALRQHCLDYHNPDERDHFEKNIFANLCQKYQTVHGKPFDGDTTFSFRFDHQYLRKNRRKSTKLIHILNVSYYAMFAPFTVIADPALMEIGYSCGFGEKNAMGLGMAETVL